MAHLICADVSCVRGETCHGGCMMMLILPLSCSITLKYTIHKLTKMFLMSSHGHLKRKAQRRAETQNKHSSEMGSVIFKSIFRNWMHFKSLSWRSLYSAPEQFRFDHSRIHLDTLSMLSMNQRWASLVQTENELLSLWTARCTEDTKHT